jgi:hypothetical protein
MTSLATAARDAVRRERKRAGLIVSLFSSWEIAKLVSPCSNPVVRFTIWPGAADLQCHPPPAPAA